MFFGFAATDLFSIEDENLIFRIRKSLLPSGFTLVEILIAIFIFSIIVTTAFASYRSILSSVDMIHRDTAYLGMAKDCLNRMILDLQSVYITPSSEYKPPELDNPLDPYRLIGDTPFEGNEAFGRLRFTSLAHLPLEGQTSTGIAQIVYYVQLLDNGSYVLRRSDRLYPYLSFEPKGTDPILCRHIRSLSFRYFDSDDAVLDRWDSDDSEFGYATPRAIRIEIEFGKGSDSQYLETRVTLPAFREKVE